MTPGRVPANLAIAEISAGVSLKVGITGTRIVRFLCRSAIFRAFSESNSLGWRGKFFVLAAVDMFDVH